MNPLHLNTSSPFYNLCTLELGRCYYIGTHYDWQWRNLTKGALIRKGVLIRTGVKGFNLLNPETSKCMFKRAIYQKDSGKKDIPDSQKHFNIRLPKWIVSVCESNEYLSVMAMYASKEQTI